MGFMYYEEFINSILSEFPMRSGDHVPHILHLFVTSFDLVKQRIQTKHHASWHTKKHLLRQAIKVPIYSGEKIFNPLQIL